MEPAALLLRIGSCSAANTLYRTGHWKRRKGCAPIPSHSAYPFFRLRMRPSIDPATKYCQGAPSISALFAEMGGYTMSLFSCRINKSDIDFHPSCKECGKDGVPGSRY